MRRGVVLAVLLLALGPTAYAAGTPALRVTSNQPFQVHGVRFHPGERVTVHLHAGELRRVRVLRATAAGAFFTTFSTVSISGCTAYLVTASGSAGSHATLRRRLFVDCSPQ